MSDDWKFFLCSMGEHAASIMVDVGIADSIQSTPSLLARVRVRYKQPREDGLPTQEEFEAVSAIEGALNQFIEGTQDAYVGRFTTQGFREFHVYTTRDDEAWDVFVRDIGDRSGYLMNLRVEEDPARDGYWKELYPTPDDWVVIRDMEVVEQLKKAGDDPAIHRQIDHWIYFPSKAAAGPFLAWATADRFSHDAVYSGPEEKGRYLIRLHHIGPTHQTAVSSHTIALRRKAQEFGGEYDGWETSVEKATSA